MSINKPSLVLHKDSLLSFKTKTLGMSEILNSLIGSGLFSVSFHDQPEPDTLRCERAQTIYLNNKKIYLDFWEYSQPTYSMEVLEANYDIIIKLQKPEMDHDRFEEKCNRKNVLTGVTYEKRHELFDKVVPWTFFPSKMLHEYILGNKPLPRREKEIFGFFCGKPWHQRNKLRDKFKEEGIVDFIDSDQTWKSTTTLQKDDYLQLMINSKFGISLHGRMSHFTEAKNRREIDYMFLKKPLLMNYCPHYYDPLIDGHHYVSINLNTDFKKLEDEYDWDKIAENGYNWYMKNASPYGVAESFMKIMKDRGLM